MYAPVATVKWELTPPFRSDGPLGPWAGMPGPLPALTRRSRALGRDARPPFRSDGPLGPWAGMPASFPL
jgi:hypothetical protein